MTYETRHEMIARAAYLRAESRGFEGGDPVQDWLEAEVQIDRVIRTRAPAVPPATETKRAFEESLAAQIREWDEKIGQFGAKAQEAKGKSRAEMESRLQALQDQRARFGEQFHALQEHAEEGWEDLRAALDKACDDMRQSMEKVAPH